VPLGLNFEAPAIADTAQISPGHSTATTTIKHFEQRSTCKREPVIDTENCSSTSLQIGIQY